MRRPCIWWISRRGAGPPHEILYPATTGLVKPERLKRAEVPGGNIATFAYDGVGNRTSVANTSPADATAYTVGTSSRMTQATTGSLVRPFVYNANGDVTSLVGLGGVTNTLTYDPFGRLSSHTRSGVTTTYTVNALDQRMGKSNSGGSSRYVYAGYNQLLAEYTNGQWTSYIWNGNTPVAMVRNNQTYYIQTDHLGRPQLATDSNRNIVWKASNYAFNRSVAIDAIGGLNLGFPGQYYDGEFGAWHNGYREYLADTGRYLQSDPIGLAGGENTYVYVGGNPTNYVDQLGLEGAGVGWTPDQMRQLGEAHGKYSHDYVAGLRDFVRNYVDMRDANTIGADKYFHCKANCEATKQGQGGKDAACNVSNAREKFDQSLKGDPPSASAADQAANIFGRNNAGSGACSEVCSVYRPPSLAPGY